MSTGVAMAPLKPLPITQPYLPQNPKEEGLGGKQKQVLRLFFYSFLGIGVGIGHHFYYAALDGRRAENQAVWKASYFLPSYRNFRAKNPKLLCVQMPQVSGD
jgi:hypothetical protein